MWQKMWFTYIPLPWIARQYVPPEIPSKWCGMFLQRLPHRLNRLTGHLAARLMTKVATWLPGWWPRAANCRTGRPRDTWGERGALSWSTRSPPFCATPPSTLAVSLSVTMDSSYWPLDITLRREFADLFESHHIAWRYHVWGLNNYWGKKQIAKVLVLGGTFGRSGPPCFVRPCTLWVRRPFLWLTQTVLLLILYNKQQILDIRDIPTIGRIIPIL